MSKYFPFAYAEQKKNYYRTKAKLTGGLFGVFKYFIQHSFICRPSDSTGSEDSGIEPTTMTLTVRCSKPKRINTYRAEAYRSSLPFPNEFPSCNPHTSESMDRYYYGNRSVQLLLMLPIPSFRLFSLYTVCTWMLHYANMKQ